MTNAPSRSGEMPTPVQQNVSWVVASGLTSSVHPLVRKVAQLGPLLDGQRRMLESLPLYVRQVEAGQDVAFEGDDPSECTLLLQGFVFRYKMVESARRQIMSFHFPGDILDLDSMLLGKRDHSIGALTPVEVVAIPYVTLREWTDRYPQMTDLFWRDTLIDAAIFREWVVNIGQRSPYTRTAHLLCELAIRMQAAGLTRGDVCELPLTHVEVADSTSLPSVDVGRVLQQLHREGLIDLHPDIIRIFDLERLKQGAMFDSNYLHHLAKAA